METKTKILNEDEHTYHTLIAGNFPVKLWQEWKKQCKEQFNDIYWHKIWTDHIKAQAYDKIRWEPTH